jgi:hypothetical protein
LEAEVVGDWHVCPAELEAPPPGAPDGGVCGETDVRARAGIEGRPDTGSEPWSVAVDCNVASVSYGDCDTKIELCCEDSTTHVIRILSDPMTPVGLEPGDGVTYRAYSSAGEGSGTANFSIHRGGVIELLSVQLDSVWGTGSPGPVSGLPMLTNGFVAVDGVSCADESGGTHFRLTFGAGTPEAFTVDSGSWDHGPDGSRAIVEAAIEWAEGMTYGPTVRLVYARGP